MVVSFLRTSSEEERSIVEDAIELEFREILFDNVSWIMWYEDRR